MHLHGQEQAGQNRGITAHPLHELEIPSDRSH